MLAIQAGSKRGRDCENCESIRRAVPVGRLLPIAAAQTVSISTIGQAENGQERSLRNVVQPDFVSKRGGSPKAFPVMG